MAICGKCGEENPDRARFCLACGAPLASEAAAAREERKVVSVLFADLVGFTSRAERLDPEEVRAVQSRYWNRVRTEIERYGGTVEKFIGDAVMALFGAPVAHEDDPERAVRAALSVRDAVVEDGRLQVRSAITTGEALVALGARPDAGEGMASGDVVNTAARLQGAAPTNGILVDETTYRATQQAIEYREAAPVQAKGKSEPLAVWEALEPRWRFGAEVGRSGGADLVGRREELDVLVDALARARRERCSQLVTLVGVPGIGKSRLVSELFAAVEADAELIYWRQGRSLPYGEGVTFWALAEMVKAHAGILETDSADQAEDKLRTAVAEVIADEVDIEWVSGHLRPLVGVAAAEALGEDRRAEVFAAWRKFFEALAERRPLVLVFEDLQWADDGLLDFVDHLVEWASGVPLLCICTARPELLERRAGWGGGKRNATTISLSPLSEDDTARLIASLLEQAVLPAEVQSTLLARAGGNPLYAEEYVRMLQDRGFLRRAGATWQLERTASLPLPESVQGIIAARLDALPAEEKDLLQDAAVLGRALWVGALAEIVGVPRWTIEERLHALERKEFVRREQRSSVASETEYSFRHILVRDVAYGQIPRARRAEKHSRAAEWIESLAGDRGEEHAETVAHHYLAALEYARAAGADLSALAERARLALREAGDRAMGLTALSAAARFYESALELWPADDPERTTLLLRLGYCRFHERGEGEEPLAEARDAALARGHRDAAAEAEVWLANIQWYRGRRDATRAHVERANEIIADAPPSRAKALVLSQTARFHMLAGENRAAIGVGSEAVAMAAELGLGPQHAGALNTVGVARVQDGDEGGIADLERSIEMARGAGSPLDESRGYVNLASVLLALGDVDRAYAVGLEAKELSERLGAWTGLRFVEGSLIADQYFRGDWDASLRLAERFIAEAEAGSPHYLAASAFGHRALIRLARGDESGAADDLAPGLELARHAKDPQILYPALEIGSWIALEAGLDIDAGKLIDEVMTSVLESGEVGLPPPLTWAPWVARATGLEEKLFAVARLAKKRTPWIEGALAILEGDFVGAVEIYAGMPLRPCEAYARLRAAEALAAAGRRAEADAQLQQALAFFRGVGATKYLREGESLLAASA